MSFVDYKHFNGNLTHVNTKLNYLSSFKNLGYYDYSTSNDYFEYHIEHDFKGYILGKIPLINKLNYRSLPRCLWRSSPDERNEIDRRSGQSHLGRVTGGGHGGRVPGTDDHGVVNVRQSTRTLSCGRPLSGDSDDSLTGSHTPRWRPCVA